MPLIASSNTTKSDGKESPRVNGGQRKPAAGNKPRPSTAPSW
jgi:hypothetical protein